MGRRSDDVGGGSQDVNIHGATCDWLRGRYKLRSSVAEREGGLPGVSVTKCGRVHYCHYCRIVIKQCYFLTYIGSEISQSNQKTRRHAQERKPGHATGGTLQRLLKNAILKFQ